MRVADQTAIVTGGASGLGEAVTRRLVAAGATVVVVDLDGQRAGALAAELGPAVRAAPADVTDADAVCEAVAAAAACGPLRALVNCAGIGVAPQRTVSRNGRPYPLDRFVRAVQVNLVGTFNVVRLAAAHMVGLDPVDPDGARGVIVNTASLAAFDGQAGQVAYAAAKAGVAGMTLPLARDLAPVGVRVCTIAPGTFDTPIFHSPDAPADVAAFQQALVADAVFPRRLGRPDEFATLVEEIIRNDLLNGETIRLDAGARLRPNPGR